MWRAPSSSICAARSLTAHERTPPDLGGDQEPVSGQAAERGPGGRVADAELREQRDQRGRRQGLGVLPPVVPEQREQQPRGPLGDPPRPGLGAILAGEDRGLRGGMPRGGMLRGGVRQTRHGHVPEGIERPCAMTTAITRVHSDARHLASMLNATLIGFGNVTHVPRPGASAPGGPGRCTAPARPPARRPLAPGNEAESGAALPGVRPGRVPRTGGDSQRTGLGRALPGPCGAPGRVIAAYVTTVVSRDVTGPGITRRLRDPGRRRSSR